MALLGPDGFREVGELILQRARTTPRGAWPRSRACEIVYPAGFFKEFVVNFDGTGQTVAEINAALRERGIFGGRDLSADVPATRPERALLRHRDAHGRPTSTGSPTPCAEVIGDERRQLPRYHAAVWDEPLVMELGAPGPARRRAAELEPGDRGRRRRRDLVPAAMRRARPPALPELSEPEVQRHYLHLAQETLGMMGISLFGTCTMKYNPRVAEHARDAAADRRAAPATRTRRRCRACSRSCTAST